MTASAGHVALCSETLGVPWSARAHPEHTAGAPLPKWHFRPLALRGSIFLHLLTTRRVFCVVGASVDHPLLRLLDLQSCLSHNMKCSSSFLGGPIWRQALGNGRRCLILRPPLEAITARNQNNASIEKKQINAHNTMVWRTKKWAIS